MSPAKPRTMSALSSTSESTTSSQSTLLAIQPQPMIQQQQLTATLGMDIEANMNNNTNSDESLSFNKPANSISSPLTTAVNVSLPVSLPVIAGGVGNVLSTSINNMISPSQQSSSFLSMTNMNPTQQQVQFSSAAFCHSLPLPLEIPSQESSKKQLHMESRVIEPPKSAPSQSELELALTRAAAAVSARFLGEAAAAAALAA
eukprot:CAMPEP_0194391516 /NCGR_PEP_ID=MMETSP0174-20130528/116032_1 /TAXON_ID=216777 /ORGANISM="Proboscia alata, Strain PI-D3" /LENGTH=201 /DNA_ID=CAMNT_0039185907 /DNA_START=386 /DNA_END=988 /DNA_ORIENTATION=-